MSILKHIVLLIITIFWAVHSTAQNLVKNGSFEEYYFCPVMWQGNIDTCKNWFQPLKTSTSDWFNECAAWAANGGMGAPKNIFGYQYARTGNGYAGIAGYLYRGPVYINQREYIETQLSEPLERKRYCVRFFVSLADTVGRFAINNMSAYFTNDSVLSDGFFLDYPFIEAQAQVSSPPNQYLNDYQNWMEISGSFVAQGGEKFLTIGNFKKDSNILIQIANPQVTFPSAYYYIDDVSVYPCDAPIYSAYAGIDTTICIDSTYILQTSPRPQYEYAWLTLNGDTLSYNPSDTVTIKSDTAFVLMQRDFKFDITKDTIYIKSKDCTPIIPPEPPAPYFDIYPTLINDNTLQIHAHNYLGNVSVLLYDAIGKLIYKQAVNISQTDQTITLKTMDLASGFYVCKIINGNGVLKSERVVVIHD